MNEKIFKALNDQLNSELYSAYLYLSMAAYFQSINLSGFANWMKVQAMEEEIHAMKFFDFINERGGRVDLSDIKKPPHEWESPLTAFQVAYDHERLVTGLINELADLALKEKDHATYNMLQWFVSEQVEEESSANDVVQKLKLFKGEGNGLFIIDRELAQRVFVMPAGKDK